MADAIEARRMELGLTVGELSARSGVTEPGLMPLRRGELREYRDASKIGLCRALGWTTNSIDLLMDGEPPVQLVDTGVAMSVDEPAMLARAKAILDSLPPDKLAKAEGYLDALQDPGLRTTNGG